MTVLTHGSPSGWKHGCRCDLCSAAKEHFNGKRDEQGVIATLRDLDTRTTVTIHVPGLLGDAARLVCAHCDTLGGSWRVQTLSTPRTIMRDLEGHRGLHKNGKTTFQQPEIRILGQVGRRDLLAPELIASSADSRSFR